MQATHKNFDELHVNQLTLDTDNTTMKGKIDQIALDFSDIETRIMVNQNELKN